MNELHLPEAGVTFLVGRVAYTRCDNDLTQPDSVQSDYSTTINLPDAAPVRRALGHAEQGTSSTTLPYRKLAAVLRLGGVEVVPRGQLLTWSHTHHEGFEVQVFGGNVDLYTALGDKKLRELNLSAYDHAWTLPTIVAGAQRTSSYRYELYDRGQGAPVADTALNVFEAGSMAHNLRARCLGTDFHRSGCAVVGQPAGDVRPAGDARHRAVWVWGGTAQGSYQCGPSNWWSGHSWPGAEDQ